MKRIGPGSVRIRKFITSWLILLLSTFSVQASANSAQIPDELYEGMLTFAHESDNYLSALTLMNEEEIRKRPVAYARALAGFNMPKSSRGVIDQLYASGAELSPMDQFHLGRLEYFSENWKPALRAFKKAKNKLPLQEKQEWSFYRANTFLELGSAKTAAQALNDFPDGLWAAHGYHNLAIAYSETSAKKDDALLALRVASSMIDNSSPEERELSSRIYFAAGTMLLESGKPDKAANFFNKVYLESYIAPQALYLNGLAHLKMKDFSGAIQYWNKVKTYHLVHPGVSDAVLAVPYAFEGAGRISQALEVYLEASTFFESELKSIRKLQDYIKKHGAYAILIEGRAVKGLEWFLAKDVAKNEARAAYYAYLMQNEELFENVRLIEELKLLQRTLDYWSKQLKAFDVSLKSKSKNFSRKVKQFSADTYRKKAADAAKRLSSVNSNAGASGPAISNIIKDINSDIESLESRLVFLESKIKEGNSELKAQLQQSVNLASKIKSRERSLGKIIKKLDGFITAAVNEELNILYDQMVLNFEQSEQGLVNIFESVAVQNNSKSNPLDKRFQ